MHKLFQAEETYLSNGIPVILQHYDGPVASTYWWVRVGSADESPREAGFAHFLEHMLFKDASAKETGKASTGRMARTIESLGGDVNAYTAFDQTVYHVTCAAHQWERVIDAFGLMAKPQKFLMSDFEREREVILEELRRSEDSPERQIFNNLFHLTFRKHPYGRPVIGFERILKAATVRELEMFYRRNYVSQNMGVILVGPVYGKGGSKDRVKTLLRFVEKRFGSNVISPHKAITASRKSEPALRAGAEVMAKRFDVKAPTLNISFRVPNLLHMDIPPMDLVSGILSFGELSRLYQRLFYQTSLATGISGGLYVPHDPGMFYVHAEMSDVRKIGAVAEEIMKEMRKLCDEGPSDDELERVITNAESERLYATQTADALAARLGFLKFVLGDLEFDQKYIEELKSVDGVMIKEVARRYLDHHRMSCVALVPSEHDVSEIAEMAAKLLDFQEKELRTVFFVQGKKAVKKPAQLMHLPSGVSIVYYDRPQSHVFSIHAAVLGGVRLELTDWGSSNIISMTWNKGTKGFGDGLCQTTHDISKIIEGSAASMDGFSGRHSIGLQLTGLSRDWGKLSALFSEVLLTPSFPEDEVEHSRRVTEDSIRTIEDHSAQLCSKLFLETLYENHPYGRLTYGSLESLKNMSHDTLSSFHGAWVRPERLVVSVSGSIRGSILEIWLSELEQQLQVIRKNPAIEKFTTELSDEKPLKGPRWVERKLGREQCHVVVGGLGTKLVSDDRHAVRLMQTILGGQGGRLFVELREKKSLAYTVSPIGFEGLERGYLGTYIACAPQKKEDAINGIRKVLEGLAMKGPTTAEMNRAKEFLLGKRAMDLQSDSALAAHYGLEVLYGLPILSENEMIRIIRSVSAKEVREVCYKYLVEPFMVTSIVG